MTSVAEMLAGLLPLSDRVWRAPLAEDDIHNLETQAGAQAPACVRDFLLLLGLENNVAHTHEVAGPLIVEDRYGAVAAALASGLGDGEARFPLFETPEGSVGAVRGDDDRYDCEIWICDLAAGTATVGAPSFCAWFGNMVAKAQRSLEHAPPIESLVRTTTLSFAAPDPHKALAALATVDGVLVDRAGWSAPDDVGATRLRTLIWGADVEVVRSSDGAGGVRLTLALSEPALTDPTASRVDRIRETLERSGTVVTAGLTSPPTPAPPGGAAARWRPLSRSSTLDRLRSRLGT